MLSFTGIPGAAKLEARMEQNKLTHFLTSHVALAFCYGVFLFLYDVALLRNLVAQIHPVLIAWAGCLFIYDILVRQIWKKLPYWPILALFVVSLGVTVLANLEVGLVTAAKSAVMMVLPLCAFYPVCTMAKKEERKKAFLIAMLGAAVVLFVASVISYGMYLLHFSQVVSFMGVQKITGFRYYMVNDPESGMILPGIYEDTNHAAAYAAVFTAYSLVLYQGCRKGIFGKSWQNKLGSVFGIANAVVQVLYFPLANSRGGWVGLAVALLIILSLWLYNVRLNTQKSSARALKAMGLALVCVALICGGLLLLRSASSGLSTVLTTATSNSQTSSGNKPSTQSGVYNWTSEQADSFQKTDSTMGSGRITIWKESLELYKEQPLLGNLVQHQYYAQKYNVAKNSLIRGVAVHNSYLDLLLGNGILGFALLMTFWVLCLILVLKKLSRDGKNLEWQYYAIAFCVVLTAGTSFFLTCVFTNTTSTYFMMLVPTGYLVAEAREK